MADAEEFYLLERKKGVFFPDSKMLDNSPVRVKEYGEWEMPVILEQDMYYALLDAIENKGIDDVLLALKIFGNKEIESVTIMVKRKPETITL